MTEAEWLACDDPIPMLDYLQSNASARKLRLFAVECCELVGDWIDDHCGHRDAVNTARRVAMGQASEREVSNAWDALIEGMGQSSEFDFYIWDMVEAALRRDPPACARDAARSLGSLLKSTVQEYNRIKADKRRNREWVQYKARLRDASVRMATPIQAKIVRCLFPFPSKKIKCRRAWLTGNSGTVNRMARQVSKEKSFDLLPILGDALEDAGCDNADILAHCRSEGPHVRGCWVVDLLLGKE